MNGSLSQEVNYRFSVSRHVIGFVTDSTLHVHVLHKLSIKAWVERRNWWSSWGCQQSLSALVWFGQLKTNPPSSFSYHHGTIPRLGLVSVLHVKYLQNNNKIIWSFSLYFEKKSKTKIVTSKSSSHVNSSHIHTTFWKKRELLHELPRESSLVFWRLCVCAFKSKMKSVYSRVATKIYLKKVFRIT